jgi:hypothetical protein
VGEQTLVLDGVEFESDSIDLTREAMWALGRSRRGAVGVTRSRRRDRRAYRQQGQEGLQPAAVAGSSRTSSAQYRASKGADRERLFVRGYGDSAAIGTITAQKAG